MTQNAEQQTVVVFTLTSESPLAKAVAAVADKAERYGKGQHSVQYWTEDLLSRGVQTFDNYLDADKARRDRESFNREVSRLAAPAPDDVDAMVAYAKQVQSLQRRYGIGGEKKSL
jgi:hypothetical protein